MQELYIYPTENSVKDVLIVPGAVVVTGLIKLGPVVGGGKLTGVMDKFGLSFTMSFGTFGVSNLAGLGIS